MSDLRNILINSTSCKNFYEWGQINDCQGVVVMIHGLCGSGQWFENLADFLIVQNFYCISFDIPNLSSCLIDDSGFSTYDSWFEFCLKIIEKIKTQEPLKPLVLVGNSLGSVLLTKIISKVEFDKAIFFAPGFRGNSSHFKPTFILNSLLKCFFSPAKSIRLPYSITQVTQNQEFIQKVQPFEFNIAAKYLLQVLLLTHNIDFKFFHTYSNKLKFYLAQKDLVVDNSFNMKILKNLNYEIVPNCYHDIILDNKFNEIGLSLNNFLKNN